jgi:polyisoprenyl-phosphate glycosyltransferase
MEISIITPVYGCKDCLYELYYRLTESLKFVTDNYEIIFIDDASPDKPWEFLSQLCQKDTHVKAIELSRNFGQHFAITAGLENASGKWIVVMDCDLQDQPEEIPKLYKKALEGFDIVQAQRKVRKDHLFRRLFSFCFYKLLGFLTDTKQDHTIANFGIYSKQVIEATLKMKDSIRYFPAMIQWVGFNSVVVEVEHSERISGKTSYNLKQLLSLGTNVVLSFSEKPLLLVVRFGMLVSFCSLVAGIIFLIKYYMGKIEVLGFTSLILSIWFLSGIIIFILGIIGLYLGETFDRVKERPLYIIKNKQNL